MPWNNAAMLTDKDGNFIPQLWDPSQNKFIPWDGKVQQSGTIEEILPRQVRSASTSFTTIHPPNWARGMMAQVYVAGVTGTFDTGEGLALHMGPRTQGESFSYGDIETARIVGEGLLTIILYPGANIGDLQMTNHTKISGLPLGDSLFYRLVIDGTFNQGEGFDCKMDIKWLP